MMNLNSFTIGVIEFIKQIPVGKVATYKQIAILSGKPHAARGVSWILHSCSTKYKLPWHRVLNSKGKISFPFSTQNYMLQKTRLQKEGVEFQAGDVINLDKFQWSKKKKIKKVKTLRNL